MVCFESAAAGPPWDFDNSPLVYFDRSVQSLLPLASVCTRWHMIRDLSRRQLSPLELTGPFKLPPAEQLHIDVNRT